MARLAQAAAIVLLGLPGLMAHDPITTKITFSREIIRIFHKRCLGCHKEGGPAPMSLATYEQARPWAKAIKEEVLERRMPPWGAVKGFGAFRNDRALSQEEVNLIADWVEGGAPEGEPKYLPNAPPADPPPNLTIQGRRIPLNATTQLATPLRLLAIVPQVKTEKVSARVTAALPDGRIEPLLWLRDYKPAFTHGFEMRTPLLLPAGSRIIIEPEDAAQFTLLVADPKPQVRKVARKATAR